MGKYIFIFITIVLVYYCWANHIKIKWLSFLKKGFVPDRGKFGVYCFCGKQGQGKTLNIVNYLKEHQDKKIFCNIKSLKGIEYTYFDGFDELLKLRNERDCIIVYDEIFTALTRTSKMNTDVLDFLSQMRKRKIIFLTSAQEWLEINITLRRYCRYQIDCKMINLFGIGIIKKVFYDAELLKWDNLQNEYVAPVIETVYEKTNLKTAEMYNTYETINTK